MSCKQLLVHLPDLVISTEVKIRAIDVTSHLKTLVCDFELANAQIIFWDWWLMIGEKVIHIMTVRVLINKLYIKSNELKPMRVSHLGLARLLIAIKL